VKEREDMSAAFTQVLMSFFKGRTAAQEADRALKEYFSKSGNRFTGSRFEEFCDSTHPDEITERDLVAVSMLGVAIPPRPALWILSGDGRSQISALLSQVPTSLNIWDNGADLSKTGAMWQLWDLLGRAHWPEPRKSGGLGGFTKRSKLLASKRPHLMPVLDDVVRNVLPPVADHWKAFRQVLQVSQNRKDIEAATTAAPGGLSLLRKIDIVLWMTARRGP
jgi:hypothetical protein